MPRPSAAPSSGSRAFHHKTRHGCKRCKERRVKCNMQRPVCNHCERRNERCSYILDDTGPVSYTIPVQRTVPVVQLTVDSTFQSLVYRIPISQPVLLSSLLRQVKNESQPASTEERGLWRTTLVRSSLADSHHLWHSLTALHLLHQRHGSKDLDLQKKLLDVAYQHHIRASKLFISITPIVTEHNWPVFLGFSISVMVCQLAMQAVCPEPLFDYIEMFQVLRTTRDIDESLQGWIRASKMWPMIVERTRLAEHETPDEYGVQEALGLLEIAVEENACASTNSNSMHVAMQCLKNWVKMCQGRPRRWGDYIYWPAVLDTGFIDSLKIYDSLALVIFLHWVAIMRLSPPRWYFEIWLLRTAEHVTNRLPLEWRRLVAWPASMMHADLKEAPMRRGGID